MTDFARDRIDPIAWMNRNGLPAGHISYDPMMRRGDYSIIRQQSHDGTQLFTHQMLFEALQLLAYRQSYHKPRAAEYESVSGKVWYVIGKARLATVYGKVALPAGRYPGQRERLRIPVRMRCTADSASSAPPPAPPES